MEKVIVIIITAVLLLVQYYLSSRRQWLLGGLLPVISIIFAVSIKTYFMPSFSTSPLVAVPLALLVLWVSGRGKYKRENAEKEKRAREAAAQTGAEFTHSK